jgi:hypothetical protein
MRLNRTVTGSLLFQFARFLLQLLMSLRPMTSTHHFDLQLLELMLNSSPLHARQLLLAVRSAAEAGNWRAVTTKRSRRACIYQIVELARTMFA